MSTLRARIEANDEWISHSQRLYMEENRRNGQHAQDLRKAAGPSLRKIARRMGISAVMLSDLERGNRNWSAAMLTKWEKAMPPPTQNDDGK